MVGAAALLVLGQLVGGPETVRHGADLSWVDCDWILPDENGLLPPARCWKRPGGATVRRPILPAPPDFREQAMSSVPSVPGPWAASTWVVATPRCAPCDLSRIVSDLTRGAKDCGRARLPNARREQDIVACFRAMPRTMMRFDGIGFDYFFDYVYVRQPDGGTEMITIGANFLCDSEITIRSCPELPPQPGSTMGCIGQSEPVTVCSERVSLRWEYSAPRPISELYGLAQDHKRFPLNGARVVCVPAWGRYACMTENEWNEAH